MPTCWDLVEFILNQNIPYKTSYDWYHINIIYIYVNIYTIYQYKTVYNYFKEIYLFVYFNWKTYAHFIGTLPFLFSFVNHNPGASEMSSFLSETKLMKLERREKVCIISVPVTAV